MPRRYTPANLLIDVNEPKDIKSRLMYLQPEIVPLQVGDYVVAGVDKTVLIERKTYIDLVKSVRSGHLWDQLSVMYDTEYQVVLLLEGVELDALKYTKVTFAELIGMINSIAVNWNTPIIPTTSPARTAEHIKALVKSLGKPKEYRVHRLTGRRKVRKDADWPRALIEGLPNVGSTRAVDLLKRFNTARNVFNAQAEELKKVPGVGKRTAKEINRVLDMEYARTSK